MISDTLPGGIGARLRDARQRGGISLRQVADSTKVPVNILQALERNDISRLPGGLYSRGFVRSFAIAVALDPEETVAAFVAQFPLGSVTCGYPAAERVDVTDVSDRRRPPRLRLAAVGVLPVVLVVYLGTTKGMPQWPALRGSVAGHPGSGDTGDLPSQPLRSDGPPALSNETSLPVPVSVLADSAAAPSAVRAEEPSTPVAALQPPMDVAPGSSPANAESSADSLSRSPLAVVLAASSPSWVIATVDGRKIVNRLFQVGEKESLEAHGDLVLTAGDAGAIMMTLNGRMARSLGRPGQTVTAHISRANFKDYLRR